MGDLPHNPLLEAALQMAGRNWFVFPIRPRTKQPLVKWKSGATTDRATIVDWWSRWPAASVGIATGPSGLTVLDPDGPSGAQALQELVRQHGPLPRTLVVQTARGFHIYFAGSGVRSTAKGDLHVRGEGGLVVAPPSIHASGQAYRWVDLLAPLAALPAWVQAWRDALGGLPAAGGPLDLGPLPAHLAGMSARPLSVAEPWSQHEEARIRSALAAVPADSYQEWVEVGMALHSLRWERGDGTDIGQDIWDAWSSTCAEKYAPGVIEEKWQSFGRSGRSGIGIGTLIHLAQQHGWNPQAGFHPNPVSPLFQQQESEVVQHKPELSGNPDKTEPSVDPIGGGPFLPGFEPEVNGGLNGAHALPAALTAVRPGLHWIDVNKAGRPVPSCANARVAMQMLELECRHDKFHEKYLVNGHALERYAGELSDPLVQVLRVMIHQRYGFDPTGLHMRDAAEQLCLAGAYDPVLDYLDGLEWDGTPRLDNWIAAYLGGLDAPFTRAVGRLALVAAVRRAKEPGCKWDQVVVLEGPEDTGKSLSLRVLAGPENFSDQTILGRTDERQQEAIQGVWVYEIAELKGMRRAEVEHVKAFITRTHDRVRPAYAHFRQDRARRCVFFATTNEDQYLKSETGDRRFWPVKTGRIDIGRLECDRDQLWAEAVLAERAMAARPLVLPPELRGNARAEQEARFDADPWLDVVAVWARGRPSVSNGEVMQDCLHLQARERDRGVQMRIGNVLRRLGYERYQQREDGRVTWRYRLSTA